MSWHSIPPGVLTEGLGAPRVSRPPPGAPLQRLQASQAGPCPQHRSGRLAPHKAGTRSRPRVSVSRWAPSGPAARGGRAGSCRSGRAGSPSPARPWQGARPRLRLLRPPGGGRGGLAGLQGWAGGLPLWAPVPPGSLPNARQVEEWRPRLPGLPTSLASASARLRPFQAFPRCAPGHAGLWAFALAEPPCLAHAHRSVCGSLTSFRPQFQKSPPWPPLRSGVPPPHPSPRPALLCFYALNCELSVPLYSVPI